MPWSSNHTFLVTCALGGRGGGRGLQARARASAICGTSPSAIYRREVAAYELSRALGWDLVPETVERDDAPFGPGSLQRFVPADFSQHHFTLVEDEEHHDRLRAICAFDVVANNADRKSGHCILGEDGRVWAIDNGLCFHTEPKLRTVIWEFAGEPLPAALVEDLARVAESPPDALGPCSRRARSRPSAGGPTRWLEAGRFPVPDPDTHHYPWPLV